MRDNKNLRALTRVLLITALILAVPLVAMQFTTEVNWSVSDFVIIGILLIGTGLVYEFAVRRIKDMRSRIICSLLLLLVFLLIWAELAVGVFGTPFSGY